MLEKEILLKLYQNVEMGIVGIEAIEDKIESRSLAKLILNQKKEYEVLKEKLVSLCSKYNVEDKELGSLVKISSDVMVTMKTLMDKSEHTIAKMMMEGTNKGLIQLEELLNNYQGKDEKITELIKETIDLEHQNNEELKIYLKHFRVLFFWFNVKILLLVKKYEKKE